MKPETRLHWYFPGQVTRLEKELDRRSREGQRPRKLGRLFQTYEEGGEPAGYRVTYVPADREKDLAAQTAAGWTLAGEKGSWRLYTRPWDGEGDKPRLAGDREALKALFAKRKKTLETLRGICLVLAAGLLLGGYALDLRYVIYGGVLPLALCIPMTYALKYMEELE